jgi:hypothetical protein
MSVTMRRDLLGAAVVAILLASCTRAPAEPVARSSPQAGPSAAPTWLYIAGVSFDCTNALAGYRDGRSDVQDVMQACSTIEEVLIGEDLLGTGRDWLAEAVAYCAIHLSANICLSVVVAGPSPAVSPGPAAAPSPAPMTTDVARQVCKAARPGDIYGVTTKLEPLQDPGGAHLVWVQLVGFRNLAGKVSGAPNLASDTFYDFTEMSLAPSGFDAVAQVDVVACLVLRATALEYWYYEGNPGTLFPIHASDAILWVVDVETGRRLGSAWRLRAPASGSGDNYIYLGAEPSVKNSGQRPPTEAQVLASITKFFGQ